MDKQQFLANLDEYSSHRPLLWLALEATKHLHLPVLELGSGLGSTPYLRKYCEGAHLELFSYDSDESWAKKMGVTLITDWRHIAYRKEWGVCLVDEAPGEHRKTSIMEVNAKIIVVHDSEIVGWNGSDYQVRPLFKNFKYVFDHKADRPCAWTTALSNEIDVTKFEAHL